MYYVIESIDASIQTKIGSDALSVCLTDSTFRAELAAARQFIAEPNDGKPSLHVTRIVNSVAEWREVFVEDFVASCALIECPLAPPLAAAHASIPAEHRQCCLCLQTYDPDAVRHCHLASDPHDVTDVAVRRNCRLTSCHKHQCISCWL